MYFFVSFQLPEDLQRKILGIKNGVGSGGTRKEKKIIKVQVPTFPPTDIMYAVDKGKGSIKISLAFLLSLAM